MHGLRQDGKRMSSIVFVAFRPTIHILKISVPSDPSKDLRGDFRRALRRSRLSHTMSFHVANQHATIMQPTSSTRHAIY